MRWKASNGAGSRRNKQAGAIVPLCSTKKFCARIRAQMMKSDPLCPTAETQQPCGLAADFFHLRARPFMFH